MKWTVLGFQSPFPGADGATPGYLLQAEDKKILIDCGSGVVAQLAKMMLPYELDAVILSHFHPDHFSDIWVLRNALLIAQRYQYRNKRLPVWAPATPEEWVRKMQSKSLIDFFSITEKSKIYIGDDVSVRFYRTDHSIPCFAMKIRDGKHTILYGADSGPNTNWEQMGYGHDLMILEATFLNENLPSDPSGHLSAKQAGEIAQAMKAKGLLLTHLYPTYDNKQVATEAKEEYSGNCIVAQMGLTIDLNEMVESERESFKK